MAEPRPEKVAEVEALEQSLRASSVVILTDYRGLTVSEIGTLRSRLRHASLEYRVAKNTLLSRAAEKAGIQGLSPFLTGPTAVVFGKDDPGVPARVLQDFIRQYRKLEIKGGVVEGQALGADGVQALASLPTKVELLARVVGAVQGPLRSLVVVLSATPRGLVTALDALRKQREAAEGPAAGVSEAPTEAVQAVPAPEAAEAEGTSGPAAQDAQPSGSEPATAAAPPEPDTSKQA